MKWNIILLLTIILWSCNQHDGQKSTDEVVVPQEILLPQFQSILDSAQVTGSILFYDSESATFYSNNFNRAYQKFLPASTFKIANSIVALELGNVKNDSSVLKWDGIMRNTANWNKDLTLSEAFQYSCVPCYQELARKAGVRNMKILLDKIAYPGMVFDSSSIDRFWLEGNSRISQMEQIAFLQKLQNQQLPLTENTYRTIRSIMFNDTASGYQIFGKTGLAIRDTVTYGWYIGYIEKDEKVYFFATNIAPTEGMDLWSEFIPKRQEVSLQAFRTLITIK